MIRNIQIKDKDEWRELYQGYANFYKVEISKITLDIVWNWLLDQNHELSGLVYEINNKLVAIAHYRRMPSPLRGKDIGFLDDLYVHPDFRGRKIGEEIINKLNHISQEKGWGLIRWITRNDNHNAKSLYDRVANKSTWDVYELE
tara:strand:+ start:1142 stop:1573 length:432 start_codon:yes stop_codon:yes gene_type:complete